MNKATIIRNFHNNTSSMKSHMIRKEFIDFYTNLNHKFIRSSPVLPLNDSTIPFVNAGMSQFKGVLLGLRNAPSPRITNSQKCIRVDGKHNDLNIVGNDSYHHTFFEMLGNWSFGDYFKKEACEYAWILLTKVYKIKEDFLYVTYFSGDKKLNLEPDLECREIWLQLGVKPDHIIPFGLTDNFWEMGLSGPCGPSTEIHIDLSMQLNNQADRINKGFDDLIELWNIVFIQYQRLADEKIVPLDNYHVDTGLGFERLVTVLQNKRSTYDTDLFQPIFEGIQKLTRAPEYTGKFGAADKTRLDTSYRILADYSRMITISLADGILPDKSPKLRRIMRKAIDLSNNIFKSENILPELANYICNSLSPPYFEIEKNLEKVKYIIEYEEEMTKAARNSAKKQWTKLVNIKPELSELSAFSTPGLANAYKELQLLKDSGLDTIPGDFAFKLYDTYGLSLDIIQKLAKIESLFFDPRDFKEALKKVREKSKSNFLNTNLLKEMTLSCLNFLESKNIPKTNDSYKYDYEFENGEYRFAPLKCSLKAIYINGNLISEYSIPSHVDESQSVLEGTITKKGNIVDTNTIIDSKSKVGILLDQTSAYSTAGGQISDKGQIRINNIIFQFDETVKQRDYVFHFGYFTDLEEIYLNEEIKIGDKCSILIDSKNRSGIMKHHTATHLLNAGLRTIFPVVSSRGSDVFSEYLSYEISLFGRKLLPSDIISIENLINNCIKLDEPIELKIINLQEMINEQDISIIPGEIYPENGIRVIIIKSKNLISKEACCGTHVHKTGVLEDFCITNVKFQGTQNVHLKAVVGPVAARVRLAGEELEKKIVYLKDRFQANDTNIKELELKVKREKLDIQEYKKTIRYPYITIDKNLKILEDLSKSIKIKIRRTEKELKNSKSKNLLSNEIEKLLEISNMPFIVHYLKADDACLENISLQNIIKLCPSNIPILLIMNSENKFKARCVIPKNMQSMTFNAKIWMEKVLNVFRSEGEIFQNEDSFTAYNMQPIHISESYAQKLADEAVTVATQFASNQINKSRSNSDK